MDSKIDNKQCSDPLSLSCKNINCIYIEYSIKKINGVDKKYICEKCLQLLDKHYKCHKKSVN